MKNLFDKDTYTEIINRLNTLTPNTQRQWGKMNVAQMLAHCKEAFKVPLSDKKMPRSILGLLVGWMIKSKLYNDEPWKRTCQRPPILSLKMNVILKKKSRSLLAMINQFHHAGPGNVGKYPHPMFGAFTPEQWGQSMYKHLDHHLMQFGV